MLALKSDTSGGQSPSPTRRSKLFVGLQSRVQMRMSFPEQKRSRADKEIAGASPWELPWLIVDFHYKSNKQLNVIFSQFQKLDWNTKPCAACPHQNHERDLLISKLFLQWHQTENRRGFRSHPFLRLCLACTMRS